MKWTTSIFIDKANHVHDNFYSYEKTKYVTAKSKVTITCPIHGDFEQLAYKHIYGNKCMSCFRESKSLKQKNKNFHVDIFNEVHNNFYNYDKFIYTKAKNKIIITCPIHGDFEQVYAVHKRGQGCIKCGNNKHKLSQDDVIRRFNKVHNKFYNYDKVKYIRSDKKVIITCPAHGDFWQDPMGHMRGHGCKKCWETRRDNYNNREKYIGRPTTLYYIKVDNLFKIGLTRKSVEDRFKHDLKNINIEIIETWHFDNGEDAYDKEQKILKAYVDYRYKGENILKSGNTELFTEDVLKLMKEK